MLLRKTKPEKLTSGKINDIENNNKVGEIESKNENIKKSYI